MLETIWFLLWGLLWAIYFTLDGFDLGLGTAMPFLAKNDKDVRTIYNSLRPFWDGNEVWLITAGGVTFAAFPTTYAVMFSTLYTPLLLILFALIIRAVSFEFRGKIEGRGWNRLWDTCLFLGSFAPALLFGVAFANIFQGIPFDAKGVFHGNLLSLLNPYGIVGGLLFVLLFVLHGLLWLAIKTSGDLHERTVRTLPVIWVVLLVVAVIFLVHTWFATPLYDNYLGKSGSVSDSIGNCGRIACSEAICGQGEMVDGLVRVGFDHSDSNPIWCRRTVPESVSIQHRSCRESNGIQFVIQSVDTQDNAGGSVDFCACGNRLSDMVLLSF